MENKFRTRKNIRLSKYNYSNNGSYFITICVKNRECLLSKIVNSNNSIELTKIGKIVEKYIQGINNTYQ